LSCFVEKRSWSCRSFVFTDVISNQYVLLLAAVKIRLYQQTYTSFENVSGNIIAVVESLYSLTHSRKKSTCCLSKALCLIQLLTTVKSWWRSF